MSRLPRVDGTDDMAIDDAVDVTASAMGPSDKAHAVGLGVMGQRLIYKAPKGVSEADLL